MRRASWVGKLGVAAVLLPWLAGCGAVVHGGPLSHRPVGGTKVFLSTGGASRPYRTLGFIQVMGEGRTYAGVVDVGDAGLDGVVRGTLQAEAERMGGDGVIHIEFLDENPQTDYERLQQASETVSSIAEGKPQVSERKRSVVATGEVIQFIHPER